MSWQRLGRKTIYHTKHLTIYEDAVKVNRQVVLDDYSVVKFNDVVLVVATTPEGKLLAFKEYKYAVNQYVLTVPAGTFDDAKEAPLHAAQRELMEEAGYKAESMTIVMVLHDYPTKCPHKVYVVRAVNAQKVADPQREVSEEIGDLLLLDKDYKQTHGQFTTTSVLAALAVTLPDFIS